MQFIGSVIRKTFAPGSKSERESVMLVTSNGEYRLERVGGNPFQDADLDRLVGRKIECDGEVLEGHTIRMSGWKVVS